MAAQDEDSPLSFFTGLFHYRGTVFKSMQVKLTFVVVWATLVLIWRLEAPTFYVEPLVVSVYGASWERGGLVAWAWWHDGRLPGVGATRESTGGGVGEGGKGGRGGGG